MQIMMITYFSSTGFLSLPFCLLRVSFASASASAMRSRIETLGEEESGVFQGLDEAGEDETLEGDGKELSLWLFLLTGIGWELDENGEILATLGAELWNENDDMDHVIPRY